MNKPKTIIVAALALASLCVTSGVEAQQQPAQQAAPQLPQAPNMTFFVTSVGPGKGADLGGLEGGMRVTALATVRGRISRAKSSLKPSTICTATITSLA